MTQKWFWGFLTLIFLLFATTNILVILLTWKASSPVVGRADWGAQETKGELKILTLPVSRIIVTQTGDKESCDNPVRTRFAYF